MEFIPLYYKEKLTILNTFGDVGVVSLWSPVKVVVKHLENAGIDLGRESSRIAAIGTLYGDGLPELLRNLLYNPQINYLLLFGVDLGRSRESLLGFFHRGVEQAVCLGAEVYQIIGTNQKIDREILPEDLLDRLTVIDIGVPNDQNSVAKIKDFFANVPPKSTPEKERRSLPLATFLPPRYPSDPRGHSFVAKSPLEAWKELIHRLYRFGYRSSLKNKGDRMELQNVKVTIEQPQEEPADVLREYDFDLGDFLEYQRRILSADFPPDQEYGYGNRLRGYFKDENSGRSPDTLLKAVELLTNDPESRHAYISLWDTSRDLLSGKKGHPCLVSLFFRKFDGVLTMTAVFRTHNALRAWIENVYGLIAVQRFVCEKVAISAGPITVMSHSISIDPQGNGLDKAVRICNSRKQEREAGEVFEEDPHGNFQVTVNEEEFKIVVDHRFEGQLLTRYTGSSATELEQQLVTDVALSKISHALYLGREIGRAESRIQTLLRRNR